MNEQTILNELTEILRDVLDMPSLTLTSDTTAPDVEKWDSLNNIHIVVAIEEHFKIKIHTGEVEELRNVGDMVALIGRKLAALKS